MEESTRQLAMRLSARMIYDLKTAKRGPKFKQYLQLLETGYRLSTAIEELLATADQLREAE
jgi:hypothetical protein